VLGGGADAPVQPADFANQLGGEPAMRAGQQVTGPDTAQQVGGGVGGQRSGCAAGDERGEQRVKPVDRLWACGVPEVGARLRPAPIGRPVTAE
jgi:hypothetical protein